MAKSPIAADNRGTGLNLSSEGGSVMTMNMDHHGVVHFEMVAENPEKLSQFYTNLSAGRL